MKLLMLVRNDQKDPKNIGFFKKFFAQLYTFQNTYQINAFFLYARGNSLHLEDIGTGTASIRKKFSISLFKNLFFYREAWKAIRKISPDVLYIRYKISEPLFLLFLRKISRRKIKILLEFPTFPYDKNWKTESLLKKAVLPVDRFFRKFLKKYVSLAINCSSRQRIFSMESLHIQNGFSVNIKEVSRRPDLKDSFHLTGVAVLGFWHGYDRVIYGLKNYYRRNTFPVYLHVVGSGPVLNEIKRLVRKLELDKYVSFYGILSGEDLNRIYDMTHAALGTLGWHRMDVFESATLKNREYCVKAIPFVFAGEDPDFPVSFPYAFRISENEDPVDIASIMAFYSKLDQGNLREEMISFAREHLSWEKKLLPVNQWIQAQRF